MTDITGGLVERLARALSARVPEVAQEDGARYAAVAVVIADGPDPAILFVRREERDGDPWSGHIAFPGGFRDGRDASIEATASREAHEETRLELDRVGRPLGRLDDVAPRSLLLPRITVTPVVFAVPDRVPVFAGPEVAEVAWLSVAEVFSAANRHPHVLDLPGGPRTFDSIRVGDYLIWGLTERVLAQIPPLVS